MCSCSQHKAHKHGYACVQIFDHGKCSGRQNHIDPILNQLKLSNIFSSAPMYHTEYHVLLSADLVEVRYLGSNSLQVDTNNFILQNVVSQCEDFQAVPKLGKTS